MLENCKISGFADEIDKDFSVQMGLLKKLDQHYVELRSADGIGVTSITMEKAHELKQIMQANLVQVSAIGSPIGKIMITDDFDPHFKEFKHIVELAKYFDTPYIRMFSFFIPEGLNADSYREEVLKRTQSLIEYAIQQNVVLLHENEKEIYGDTVDRCVDLMKTFYCSNYQFTFDFANFVQCKQDTLYGFDELKSYIHYIHVKDALMENGQVVLPGDGNGHVKEILQKLDAMNYQGFLSLEPHLVSFEGLDQLEHHAATRILQDGAKAYESVHTRLLELCK